MNTLNKKSTSLRLNQGLYNYIEKLAKKENRSINNLIETLLLKATDYKEPNEETIAAIKEARANKGKGYTNTEELFKELAK